MSSHAVQCKAFEFAAFSVDAPACSLVWVHKGVRQTSLVESGNYARRESEVIHSLRRKADVGAGKMLDDPGKPQGNDEAFCVIESCVIARG